MVLLFVQGDLSSTMVFANPMSCKYYFGPGSELVPLCLLNFIRVGVGCVGRLKRGGIPNISFNQRESCLNELPLTGDWGRNLHRCDKSRLRRADACVVFPRNVRP